MDFHLTKLANEFYFASGRSARCCDERVCMSVRLHNSKTHTSNFTKFSVLVSRGCGSVLLWQQCNMLCTSGFVDDVMFAHNRPGNGDANRAYTQSDSPAGSTGDEIWCIRLPCWPMFTCF